jgi:HK97 family phage major capsid protein
MIKGVATGNWTGADNERRALQGNVDASGGFLLPASLSDITLDFLRDASVLSQAGVRVIEMKDRVYGIPRLASDPVSYWRSENVAITESSPTFERADLRSFTCGALVDLSQELFEDARDAGDVVAKAIAGSLASEFDRAGLLGSGAGEPTGLLNADDISINAATGAIDLDGLIDAGKTLEDSNVRATGRDIAMVTNPAVAYYIFKLKDGGGDYQELPFPVSNWIGPLVTNNISDNTMFIGRFSDLVMGVRTPIRIEVSREAGDRFAKLQVGVRGHLRGDFVVQRPASFRILDGITGV